MRASEGAALAVSGFTWTAPRTPLSTHFAEEFDMAIDRSRAARRARRALVLSVFTVSSVAFAASSSAALAGDGMHAHGAHAKAWPDAHTYRLNREPAAHMPAGTTKIQSM